MMSALADAAHPAMQEYRCRECGAWLLTSSATWGKAEIVCRRERCKARNTIYFGGYQRVSGREDVAPG